MQDDDEQKTPQGAVTGKREEAARRKLPLVKALGVVIVIVLLLGVWFAWTVGTQIHCSLYDQFDGRHPRPECHQWPLAGNLNPLNSHDDHYSVHDLRRPVRQPPI